MEGRGWWRTPEECLKCRERGQDGLHQRSSLFSLVLKDALIMGVHAHTPTAVSKASLTMVSFTS